MSSRCRRPRCVRRGLSWIDILLLLFFMLVLVVILLPSLRDARRQAKVAKCLSNLRLLNVSTIQYCLDFDDVVPLTHRAGDGPSVAFSFAYGGKTNDDYWRGVAGGAGYIPYTERPLNVYLWSDALYATRRKAARGGAGDVLELCCYDDRTTYARAALQSDAAPLSQPCYDDIGTSFHFNLHAITGTTIDGDGKNGENWTLLSQAMFRVVLSHSASTFLAFLPDPANYALGQHVMINGNHGKLGKHEAGYLDGHAEYVFLDTTRWSGERWTALVPNWAPQADGGRPFKVHYTAADKQTAVPDTR